jgi:hypothetical protein
MTLGVHAVNSRTAIDARNSRNTAAITPWYAWKYAALRLIVE